jgi:hypothetical protein
VGRLANTKGGVSVALQDLVARVIDFVFWVSDEKAGNVGSDTLADSPLCVVAEQQLPRRTRVTRAASITSRRFSQGFKLLGRPHSPFK